MYKYSLFTQINTQYQGCLQYNVLQTHVSASKTTLPGGINTD